MKERLAPPASRVRIQRLLPAIPQEVFDAWIDPDNLREWFCPGTAALMSVELDVRVGGQFRLVIRGEAESLITGEYREVVPPHRLVFTWRSSVTHEEETLVTLDLRPQGEGTELTLTHERLPDADSAGKHEWGWTSIVTKLTGYLEKRGSNHRKEEGKV